MPTCDTVTDPPAHHEALVTITDSIAIRSNQTHDLENWNTELVRIIRVARHNSNVVESLNFQDGVLSQPAFLQRLTALEILNQRRVCPSWAIWIRNNITTIANARRQDDSRDWYFPVFDPMLHRITSSILPLWAYSGIWHATADHSSEGLLHSLPHLSFPLRTLCNCCQPRYYVIASSGGLLLVQMLILCERRKRHRGVVKSDCNCWRGAECWWGRAEWRWPSLMVINPLTKKLRVLPTFEDRGTHGWSIIFCAQGQIIVDDETNTYKVLLYSCGWTSFFVYDSKTGSWHYEHHIPTPMGEPELGSVVLTNTYIGLKYYASACMNRCLYFADIQLPTPRDWQINPHIAGVLRFLEMNIDTGDWKPCKDFPLGKLHHSGVEIREVIGSVQFHGGCMLQNLELVECMGHIFAVIPARIDDFLYPWKGVLPTTYTSMPDSKHMPLQFYVFQLDGEDVDDGVVRIEIPTIKRQNSQYKYKTRRQSLFRKSFVKNHGRMKRGQGNWFSCTAKGSMIWVNCEDYLVQYNVVSGQSKTQIIPKINGREHNYNRVGFAYRASFNMKP